MSERIKHTPGEIAQGLSTLTCDFARGIGYVLAHPREFLQTKNPGKLTKQREMYEWGIPQIGKMKPSEISKVIQSGKIPTSPKTAS